MLEPNGNVLTIDAWDDAPNKQYVWNPTTMYSRWRAYARNLFCSGHTQIGGGKTLIVGGNDSANNGLNDTTIFDPASNTWTRGPDMSVARWYPTAAARGRTGLLFRATRSTRPARTFHTVQDSADQLASRGLQPDHQFLAGAHDARLTSPLFPFLFTLTDGRIVNVGPDTVTRTITPGTWTWNTVATSSFDGGSAVMYRPTRS